MLEVSCKLQKSVRELRTKATGRRVIQKHNILKKTLVVHVNVVKINLIEIGKHWVRDAPNYSYFLPWFDQVQHRQTFQC